LFDFIIVLQYKVFMPTMQYFFLDFKIWFIFSQITKSTHELNLNASSNFYKIISEKARRLQIK